MTQVWIGCGAGFAGDRFDAAVPVVESLAAHDGPRFLIYEVMGERTLAIAQRLRREDPAQGYSPYTELYLRQVLARCKALGVRVVANFGNANPPGAARAIHRLAAELGIEGLRVAVVEGDDLLAFLTPEEVRALPTIEGIDLAGREIIAANAYLGARPVARALDLGADVVLVGRSTDAALVLGPLIHVFGWAEDALDRLAAGTLAGHLLECGAQITGAYFADPGFKDVPDLARVGFPIAEVAEDGGLVITKAAETGGLVSRASVTEQLLYEVHDPGCYLTPDVALDLREVSLEDLGRDRVGVRGARGAPPPATLKATVSLDGGWLGEGEITYAGPNAFARAELAAQVVRERCRMIGIEDPLRVDVMGAAAVFDNDAGARRAGANYPRDGEYRLRAAVRSPQQSVARQIADEVLSLYCSGPAAGGGVRQAVTPQVSTASVLVPRGPVDSRAHAREIRP